MLIHRKRRADANQGAMVKCLKKAGWHIVDLSGVGKGCPDLLATHAARMPCLIEIKNPEGRNRYTPAQIELFAALSMDIYTIRGINDVFLLIKGELLPINRAEIGLNHAEIATKKAGTIHD